MPGIDGPLRHRTGQRPTTPSSNRNRSARAAALLPAIPSARTDVYVGCAPRRRRPGGLDALGKVWALWVDCDTPAAVAALQQFSPAPAIIVRSGSRENRHAYWTLRGPISADEATTANRRLAQALGADAGAVTTAATILRPPGTQNFKHQPPTPVVAESLQPWRRVSARALVGELHDPRTEPLPVAVAPAPRARRGRVLAFSVRGPVLLLRGSLILASLVTPH